MKKMLAALALLILVLTVSPVFAQSHNANSMWVEPEVVDLTGYTVGQKFNVTVWVNVTVECGGWQFKMIYDKVLLRATRAGYTAGTRSHFFAQSGTANFPTTPQLNVAHNATHNYVLYGEMWNPMVPDNPYATGCGSLAWVEFEVLVEQPITCVLDIKTEHNPPRSKTYVLDKDGDEVTLDVYNTLIIPEFSSAAVILILVASASLLVVTNAKNRRKQK